MVKELQSGPLNAGVSTAPLCHRRWRWMGTGAREGGKLVSLTLA